MALTALAIKNLKPKATLYRVADSGGLCLEIASSGSKLWRWRYNFNGRGQMLALGKYPDVSLEQARRRRDEARDLIRAGKHPTREKKAQKLRRMVSSLNDRHTKEVDIYHPARTRPAYSSRSWFDRWQRQMRPA